MPKNLNTKSEILTAVDAAYADLESTFDTVDQAHAEWPQAFGTWSVINVLQHLDGWLVEMHGTVQRLGRGERPNPDGVDYSNIEAWNAKFIELRGVQTLADARAAFQQSHVALRTALDAVADDRYGEGRTVNRITATACIEHYAEHAQDIAAFLNPDEA
jgi:hypothetical protein